MRRADITEILKKHGFKFSHKLGQNFIFDRVLLSRIADAAKIAPGDTVMEVGPGAGTLTIELAKRVGGAGRVHAVEIDSVLLHVLAETLADYPAVHVVHGDILKLDIESITGEGCVFDVVANLPYYITTPVIMMFLESCLPVRAITVMVQREVADRICAQPGTKAYGALSIAAQYRCRVEKVLLVPAGAFFPKPNVDSAVVRMEPVPPNPAPKSEKLFFALVRAAFHMRRKTLANNVSASFSIPRTQAEEAIITAGFPKTIRGEALSPNDFITLSETILQFLSDDYS